jgi:hypothetical protein
MLTRWARLGGNETYASNLIEALAEIDSVNRYTLYVTKKEAVERFDNRWSNFQIRLTLPHTPLVRVPLTLSVELRRRPVDICTCSIRRRCSTPCPVVNTIHDLSFEHLPETFSAGAGGKCVLLFGDSAQRAAHIITDSEYSRNDILTTYNLPPDRVTTTPLAASSRFKPVLDHAEIDRVRKKYGIDGNYILTVGFDSTSEEICRG